MRLASETEPLTILGLQIGVWTVIVAAFAVIVAGYSARVARSAMKRTDAREHHRWLQEKRREAYVGFLTATRSTYESISERGKAIRAADLTEDYPQPESDELVAARNEIDQRYGDAKRALDVLEIVGPKDMAQIGQNLMARLRLDRVFYSPTRWSQIHTNGDKILSDVKETGDLDFLAAMEQALSQGHVKLEEYRKAHADHRLETLWTTFTQKAHHVLADSKPKP